MGVLSWIVFGLIVGVVAKWLMPGRDAGGLIVTILLGVAGALIGGMLGTAFGFRGMAHFDFRSLMVAVGGSLVLLLGFRMMADWARE